MCGYSLPGLDYHPHAIPMATGIPRLTEGHEAFHHGTTELGRFRTLGVTNLRKSIGFQRQGAPNTFLEF